MLTHFLVIDALPLSCARAVLWPTNEGDVAGPTILYKMTHATMHSRGVVLRETPIAGNLPFYDERFPWVEHVEKLAKEV